MAGKGGYQAPNKPAAVSGPGALSQRTDGGPADKQPIAKLGNAGYGEQAEYREIQQGAPIKRVSPTQPASPGAMAAGGPPPLDAPSTRQGEPVTAGADAGEGPGKDALGLLDESNLAASDVAYLRKYLPTLQYIVDSNPNASTSTRALVRFMRSQA